MCEKKKKQLSTFHEGKKKNHLVAPYSSARFTIPITNTDMTKWMETCIRLPIFTGNLEKTNLNTKFKLIEIEID